MMRLDSHQHFWNYTDNSSDYVWMTDEYSALQNNFMPDDLIPYLVKTDIDGTIAVQARELEKETDFLLGLTHDYPIIKGVVGWIDLCSEEVSSSLDRYDNEPLLKGFRMLIHDRADPDFANSESHARGVGYLERYNKTYDLLLRTIHLPSAIKLVDRFPRQKFVVDHIAKPKPDGSDWEAWLKGIREISKRPNVYCKLSGLVTEANWNDWKPKMFHPFLDEVIDAFGPERSMIGSDWPVCTCAADYANTMGIVENWTTQFSPIEREYILGKACAEFYDVA